METVAVCAWGISSSLCSVNVDAEPGDTIHVANVVEELLSEDEERLVLVVAPGVSQAMEVIGEVKRRGLNHYRVEATGIPETMLSGLSMDELIAFHLGWLRVTAPARLSARRRTPAVSRREALRKLFLVTREYVLAPEELPRGCGSACPYGAVKENGTVALEKCRGCMLCIHHCPGARAPGWAGPRELLYAYSYAAEKALDAVLLVCRGALPGLDAVAAEASPAKLLPVHVPCLGWLSPRLLGVVEEALGMPFLVYAPGGGACSACPAASHVTGHVKGLRESGARVISSLVEASTLAYTGYTRPRLSPGEAVERLARLLEED